ncbi:MAG: uroporphyrinogen decarboxylase family protein [Anaerobutyricum soehngenii]|nr:uroporphyrinogen decarboxylase family protein [Anaerobutyricum soehngenii]
MEQTWKCSGNDLRKMPLQIWEEDLSILSNAEAMKRVLLVWKQIENRKEIVVPLVQNIEGAVLGAGIIKRKNFWTTGEYPFSSLEEIKPKQLTLMKNPHIKAVIEVIKQLKNETVILEAEAPFSIVSALINPMELYASMQTKTEHLNRILEKIAFEEAKYLEAAINAGCHIISLAEPVGTADMVGEKYFRECSGRAAVLLLKESERFLQNSVVHLCGKLSNSMLALQMAKEEEYLVTGEEYLESLTEAAHNPSIHFVGQHCIHQKKNSTKKIHILTI